MNKVEVEIKSLLSTEESAKALVNRLIEKGAVKKSESNQLNHYFTNSGNLDYLKKTVKKACLLEESKELDNIIDNGKDISVRTRKDNEGVYIVLKAKGDETGSENGTARLEFEGLVKGEIPGFISEKQKEGFLLSKTDASLVLGGFKTQAKWSRERVEYLYKDYTVCIDKNAGYGYLAEIEKVVDEGSDVEKIKSEIRKEMNVLGIEELPQDRLARMFDYYNSNWQEYYGTDKVFNID